MVRAISWKSDHLQLIDQTLLPDQTVFVSVQTIEEAFRAIRELQVRGAPAIGITAAYGLYLGMRDVKEDSPEEFFRVLAEKAAYLADARPTAVNLSWALNNIQERLAKNADRNALQLKEKLLNIALEIHQDDEQRCKRIGEHGQAVVSENARILTHCNTGGLATGGIGTAFGVIFQAHQLGKNVRVYADETRPVLQGARLTMWELTEAGIPAELVCDNMAAALMQQKMVDMVIVGADRISADGSAANKIGTYGLAVLAHYHDIPFYVAAPLSTFDMHIADGRDIPIEIRDSDEIRRVFGKALITMADVACWNPAFDVTPPELITGIITEKGIVERPNRDNIKQVFK